MMKPDEIARNFSNVKFLVLASFLALLLTMIIGTVIIAKSNDYKDHISDSVCVNEIYACKEFVTVTEPVFKINKTILNEICTKFCEFDTYDKQDGFDSCKTWCFQKDNFKDIAKYFSGNKTVYKCTN